MHRNSVSNENDLKLHFNFTSKFVEWLDGIFVFIWHQKLEIRKKLLSLLGTKDIILSKIFQIILVILVCCGRCLR